MVFRTRPGRGVQTNPRGFTLTVDCSDFSGTSYHGRTYRGMDGRKTLGAFSGSVDWPVVSPEHQGRGRFHFFLPRCQYFSELNQQLIDLQFV